LAQFDCERWASCGPEAAFEKVHITTRYSLLLSSAEVPLMKQGIAAPLSDHIQEDGGVRVLTAPDFCVIKPVYDGRRYHRWCCNSDRKGNVLIFAFSNLWPFGLELSDKPAYDILNGKRGGTFPNLRNTSPSQC